MAAVQRISCSVCQVSYNQSYWHQHLFSNAHKSAVRARGLEEGALFQDGIILHTTSENIAYDVLFAPTSEFTAAAAQESLSESADVSATIESFFQHFEAGIKKRIREALTLHGAVKVNGSLSIILRKLDIDGNILHMNKSLRTKSEMILCGTELDDWVRELVRTLLTKYENMPEKGSNWSLSHIVDFELHISKFLPLRGSSFIPLPPLLYSSPASDNSEKSCN